MQLFVQNLIISCACVVLDLTDYIALMLSAAVLDVIFLPPKCITVALRDQLKDLPPFNIVLLPGFYLTCA